MCGIVAYAGRDDAEPFIVEGLKRLQYRGYDSYGYTILGEKGFEHYKSTDPIENHSPFSYDGKIGIGHTRWATHGKPSLANTHPIYSDKYKTVAVVHNGIVKNYRQLKLYFQKKGYNFYTDTDTEVIANYIYDIRSSDALSLGYLRRMYEDIDGDFAIAFLDIRFPDQLILMARGMPLYVSKTGHIASDINALVGYTDKSWRLADGDIVICTEEKQYLFPLDNNYDRQITATPPANTLAKPVGSYMFKEIKEQANFQFLELIPLCYPPTKKIFLFGCGSSYYAAKIGAHYFEHICGIPAEAECSSELKHRNLSIQPEETIFLALTQSGETKDTIDCMRLLRNRVMWLFTNNINSTAATLTDRVFDIKAGPEIGVAATKTFMQQVLALFKQAHSYRIGQTTAQLFATIQNGLGAIIDKVLEREDEIAALAKIVDSFDHCIYLGNQLNYIAALEGALKMKEVAYLHAEAIPAGEIKHGPIALIDNETLSIFLVTRTDAEVHDSISHNMNQIKARGGASITFTDANCIGWVKEYTNEYFILPSVTEELMPIVVGVALQLLAYHVAILRDNNVDKPRNLAKSVTVE